jgi:hypothetical protein
MGFLRDFGSRNHPKTREVQKARAGMAVSDETVAKYTAARGFLMAEWFGASLMVVSFTLLYLLTFGTTAKPLTTLAVCIAILALGSYVFLTNHGYYRRLDFPWAKRWDNGAIVLAGSGAVFWLLFALLEVLTFFGVRVGPPK